MESIALGKGSYIMPHRTGLGLFLKPYKGKGLCEKKKVEKNVQISLPDRALTDININRLAKEFKIPNFRGVFMRDEMPLDGQRYRESAVVNLDNSRGRGAQWVAYKKRGTIVTYFDSFGDLQPPTRTNELFRY